MPAFHAHGAGFSIKAEDVGGLTTISLPDQSKGEVDVTSHDSDGDREYLPGLRDGGTVTLEGNLIVGDDGQDELRTNYEADGQTETCVITLPGSAAATAVTYTFTGFVTSLSGDLPGDADEPGTFSATVKVAGSVTKAVAD